MRTNILTVSPGRSSERWGYWGPQPSKARSYSHTLLEIKIPWTMVQFFKTMPLEAARRGIIPPREGIAKEDFSNFPAEFLVLVVKIHLRYNSCMYPLAILEPVDYLIIGHLTRDLMPSGDRLGGSMLIRRSCMH
jgi:hypothetical protein